MYKKLLIFLVLFSAASSAQQINNTQQILNQANRSFFIQNNGQWNSEVKYLIRIGGMNAWITNSGVVYDYYRIDNNLDKPKLLRMSLKEEQNSEFKNTNIYGHIVKMELINTEKNIISIGNNQRQGYFNYFVGNDHSKWAGNVPLFDNVEIQGVYKNIDIKYYYDNGMLRYDYKAKPGADISQIKFNFEGQNGISINPNGELVLKTSLGEVTNGKIYAYQVESGTQKEVQCKFEQYEDGTVGLKAESYDAKKELIIDPLVYSTFIGGNGNDKGNSISVDKSGNAYITGQTINSNYPTTVGAYTGLININGNIFVTKLNSSGSTLVYSSIIGGSKNISGGGDIGNAIKIDTNGNVFITGKARSSDFPTTNGAYQTALHDTLGDAFVIKLNSSGDSLVYSTLIGGDAASGSGGEQAYSIAIDLNGDAFITGVAGSGYPTTNGAYQTSLNNIRANAFVTKLNSSGSALLYSSYLGGTNVDQVAIGYSIAIDSGGNAYITGITGPGFPTTNGAYQTTSTNMFNGFVTKFNPDGSALEYSTYLGGTANALAIDKSGNAYITGYAYPGTLSATSSFQPTGDGTPSAFVVKLNQSGSALIYSTLIGGSNNDVANSIVLDSSGNAYITGYTVSLDYPTTSGAIQTALGGEFYQNAFITELNPTGSVLLYSTYIGNKSWTSGESIAIDTGGNCFITGYTNSSNYPTTNGAYQTTYGSGQYNAFVTKLNLSPATIVLTDGPSIPNKFELMQNFPNPFNPNTIIRYALSFSSSVKIEVYNMLGQKVRELLNGQKNAGYYEVNFNITGLSSGVYFYMIYARSMDGKSEFRETKKMVLLK